MVSPWLHRARFEGFFCQQIGHHVDDLLDLTHLDMESGIAVEATAEYTGEAVTAPVRPAKWSVKIDIDPAGSGVAS